MEVDERDDDDQAERNQAEDILFPFPLLIFKRLEKHVGDDSEEHHQRRKDERNEPYPCVKPKLQGVDSRPVGRKEAGQVEEEDLVEPKNTPCAISVLPVATALAKTAVDIVITLELLMQLFELFLLANENDLL